MTQGELAAYWGAVAQIVPVLALAFVIESRVIVRRLSKKRTYRNRGLRLRSSALLFVIAFLLIVSEYAALQNLSSDPERPLRVLDHVYFWASFVAVATSLTMVVWLPISSMVAASTGDVGRWLQVHVPWSRVRRLRRVMQRQLATIEDQLRRLRDARFDALMTSATALVETSRDPGLLRDILTTALEKDPDANLLDDKGELRELLSADPLEPLWPYRVTRWFYDNLAEQERGARKLKRQIKKQLRRIDKITSVDSPEFIKIQRANMAAAAKMP